MFHVFSVILWPPLRRQMWKNVSYLSITLHSLWHVWVFVTLASYLTVRSPTSSKIRCPVLWSSFTICQESLRRCTPGWTQMTAAGRPATSQAASLHSGQHLLQVLHLQLPHPSVKRGELGEVCHLHCTDDWLRGDGLDDTHHHDIFACKNSSRWSIVQWQWIQGNKDDDVGRCGCFSRRDIHVQWFCKA